jgi:hypothetical protein
MFSHLIELITLLFVSSFVYSPYCSIASILEYLEPLLDWMVFKTETIPCLALHLPKGKHRSHCVVHKGIVHHIHLRIS